MIGRMTDALNDEHESAQTDALAEGAVNVGRLFREETKSDPAGVVVLESDDGGQRFAQTRSGLIHGASSTWWSRNANTVSYQTLALPGLSTQWFSSGK
jgi:hypothetical protein